MLTLVSKILRMASKIPDMRSAGVKTLESLKFDNKALRTLPIDKETKNFVRQVPNSCFSFVMPTEVKNPQMVAYSLDALKLIDLSQRAIEDPKSVDFFCGNKIIPGSQTAAHCYCGHQFGAFSGQLGDGAAIYLGEVINSNDERWEIQLKGAGPTPYSRHADGRKVLRSTIREFLCSEVMFYLGIPTTRAGTIVTSDSKVIRDQFYDGHAIEEKCTIVLRIAPTFIRFGSFEICKPEDQLTGRSGPSVGNSDILKVLLDYVVETFYPELWQSHEGKPTEALYLDWFKEVVTRTARLVAEWQCVGWCHGVLNTDNMSITGHTIDYGPFGFMDRFDPDFICNSSDDGGRYTYAKQPEICKWNCEKLAEALKDQIPLEQSLKIIEETFFMEFNRCYHEKMKKKIGIIYSDDDGDVLLIEKLLSTMHKTGADFTNSWCALTKLPYEFDVDAAAANLIVQCCSADELRESLKPSMSQREMQMMMMVLQTNPGLLEHLGRGAMRLMREITKIEKLNELKDVTNQSKSEKDTSLWKEWLGQYRTRLDMDLAASKKCDESLAHANQKRTKIMNSVNPRFVLRNHLCEDAIRQAENGDFSGVQHLLSAFKHIYDTNEEDVSSCAVASAKEELMEHYTEKPPSWAMSLRVS